MRLFLALLNLLFLYNVLANVFGKGERADNRVWEGSHGLEWTLDSPPPYHSFTTPPNLTEIKTEVE